ncbi:hypothetical protein [Streptacidiphilus rugosus]|uniref:hypothetical protein n=1 Tax=Streptacidiphilus rugosus TaxID=405783 RepID=UPI0005603C71|nr:hypothetical protein [Streptacidiphilus rugosus]
MGTSVELWRPRSTPAAIRSLSDALDCALALNGAVSTVMGTLPDEVLSTRQVSTAPAGFALATAGAALAYARRSDTASEAPHEIMITGAAHCVLMQTTVTPTGLVFAQVTLERRHANPALAQWDLRRILHRLPGLPPSDSLPRRPVGAHVTAAVASAESAPLSLLQRVLDRLRALP